MYSSGESNERGMNEMFWFKACPKCHGDLYSDTDVYGSYIACLQCGSDLTEAQRVRFELAAANQSPRSPIPAQIERLAA